VRNSQPDKSASVRGAELLTVTVSRTSRRNVLGAIALKRSIATSRGDENRDERKTSNYSAAHPINFESSKSPPALPLRNDPDGDRSRLTDSFRNGLIRRGGKPHLPNLPRTDTPTRPLQIAALPPFFKLRVRNQRSPQNYCPLDFHTDSFTKNSRVLPSYLLAVFNLEIPNCRYSIAFRSSFVISLS